MSDGDQVVFAGGQSFFNFFGAGVVAEFHPELIGGLAVAHSHLVPAVAKGAHGENGGFFSGTATNGGLHQTGTGSGRQHDGVLGLEQFLDFAADAFLQSGAVGAAVADHGSGQFFQHVRTAVHGARNKQLLMHSKTS